MHHQRDGLFFQRLQDGRVRIIKTSDGREPDEGTGSNIVLDQTIPPNEWESVTGYLNG